MRQRLPDDPAVAQLCAALTLPSDTVLGLLFRFWAWVDEYQRLGFIAGASSAHVDRLIGVTGFSRALVDVGWAEFREKGLYIPNWKRWFDRKLATTRASDPTMERSARRRVTTGAMVRQPIPAEAEAPAPAEDDEPSRPLKPDPASKPDAAALWGTGTIQFDPVAAEWLGIGDYHRQAWAKRHPELDVERQLAAAAAWCVQNPARGRQENYAKFLSEWMKRAETHGKDQ